LLCGRVRRLLEAGAAYGKDHGGGGSLSAVVFLRGKSLVHGAGTARETLPAAGIYPRGLIHARMAGENPPGNGGLFRGLPAREAPNRPYRRERHAVFAGNALPRRAVLRTRPPKSLRRGRGTQLSDGQPVRFSCRHAKLARAHSWPYHPLCRQPAEFDAEDPRLSDGALRWRTGAERCCLNFPHERTVFQPVF